MKLTIGGYTCDSCEREVAAVYLGDRNEDLCADCFTRATGQPTFAGSHKAQEPETPEERNGR